MHPKREPLSSHSDHYAAHLLQPVGQVNGDKVQELAVGEGDGLAADLRAGLDHVLAGAVVQRVIQRLAVLYAHQCA